MHKIFYFVILICFPCLAQKVNRTQSALLTMGNGSLTAFIQENIRFPKSLRDSCISTLTIAKFDVDATGRIDTILFSRGTPLAVKNEIKRVLRLTDVKWLPKLANGKPVVDRNYLLPLEFEMQYWNCPKAHAHTKTLTDLSTSENNQHTTNHHRILPAIVVVGFPDTHCGPVVGADSTKITEPSIPVIQINIPFEKDN